MTDHRSAQSILKGCCERYLSGDDLMNFQSNTKEITNKHILESFRVDTIHAPFTIILIESVTEVYDTVSNISEHSVPDFQDLLHSIVLYRTIQPNKLKGSDIKFLRKSLGLRALEVSKPLSISREHFSRCENENVPLSSSLEILLRVFIFCKIAAKLGDGLLHRNITFQSGIDMIFNIVNSNNTSDDSSDFILHLKRNPVRQDHRILTGSKLDFVWIKTEI